MSRSLQLRITCNLARVFSILALCAACIHRPASRHPAPPGAPSADSTTSAPDSAYSNIRREDYVGPEACGKCHPDNYARWKQHPHSRMNAMASAAAIVGDFSGVTIDYAGRHAVFRKEGERCIVEYFRGDTLLRAFRVTRTIGWRYEQNYVAVQTYGPEPPTDLLYTEEIRLGFSWSIARGQWLPQSYLEPSEYPGSEYLPDGRLRYDPFEPTRVPFNQRCARCHNTYPYDLRFYRINTEFGMLSGFAPGRGAEQQVVLELARRNDDAEQILSQALPKDRFVTVGISCESCHFGGREHVTEGRGIRFVPTHPLLGRWTPDHVDARKNPEVVNAICSQCHHSGAYTEDNWPDGSAGVNSLEAVEMTRGACASEIRCTDCHNPHLRGPDAGSADRPAHIEKCLSCHDAYRAEEAAAAHSGHGPAEASCLDCHMPRVVQGLNTENRSHRISSPTDPRILGTGMPNACNLCHLDRSITWTRDAVAARWGERVPLPSGLEALGDRPLGDLWLRNPASLARAVAAGAYARSPLGVPALPRLLAALDDPNAYTRLRILQAAERILGRRLPGSEFDVLAPPQRRAEQLQALRNKYGREASVD